VGAPCQTLPALGTIFRMLQAKVLPLILVSLALTLNAEEFLPTGASLDLEQCYDLALQQNEPLKRQREEIFQSQAQARAVLGGAFPHVYWDWRGTRQDDSGVTDTFGGMLEKSQVESKVILDQQIFNGLKEISAWSGFKKQEARDQWRLRQQELALYDEVARAYLDVVSLETALSNNTTTISLAQERVTELKSFYRLGKSREGEIFSAESQLATIKAIGVRLRGQIRVAREALSFLLGKEAGSLPLAPTTFKTEPPSLAIFLTQAARRPDLEAQRQEVEGMKLRVRYEKGSYWPSLNFIGNFYTQRPQLYDPIDWDMSLYLSVPLFQGGTVNARVREALSGLTQAQLTLDYLERQIQSEVKKAHAAWTASLEESLSLQEAYFAAKKSYDAQKREYRLGLVTNLDVLNATTLMQTDKRAWDDADIEAQRRYVTLIVTTGALP
jgi:outer membrane protein